MGAAIHRQGEQQKPGAFLHRANRQTIRACVERYLVLIIALLLGLPQVALILIAVLACITLAQRVHHVWRQFALEEDQAEEQP